LDEYFQTLFSEFSLPVFSQLAHLLQQKLPQQKALEEPSHPLIRPESEASVLVAEQLEEQAAGSEAARGSVPGK